MLKRLFLMMLLAIGMALPQGGFFSQSANGQAADNYVKKRFLKNVPGVGKEDTRFKELEENQNQPQNRPQVQPQPQNPQARKPYVPKAQWHPVNLTRHWEKHKAEFLNKPEFQNMKTEKDYGNYALSFFQYPPQGTLFKRNQDGDYLFYYQRLNIFGVTTKDGIPKTFFRPSAGINYWNRQ